MNIKKSCEDMLSRNSKVVDHKVSGSEEAPSVYFKINTGNGRHTEKRGDVYEYYRFYQFEGKVQDPADLEYRLNNKRPPE